MSTPQLHDLVLVAGHAAFKSSVNEVPNPVESDDAWVLQDFQTGEPPFYVEHIRRGVVLAANNPVALLVFSGGRTRSEAGSWSEAKTYYDIATARRFWIPDKMAPTRDAVAARTTTEDFAKDSFENLLFGICRFQQVAQAYPRIVTVASWAFKASRFELHRAAILFPETRFHFVGVNDPIDLNGALRGERKTVRSFIEHPFGTAGDPSQKRAARNPFRQEHEYHKCPGVKDLFDFMGDPANASKTYAGRVPWRDAVQGL